MSFPLDKQERGGGWQTELIYESLKPIWQEKDYKAFYLAGLWQGFEGDSPGTRLLFSWGLSRCISLCGVVWGIICGGHRCGDWQHLSLVHPATLPLLFPRGLLLLPANSCQTPSALQVEHNFTRFGVSPFFSAICLTILSELKTKQNIIKKKKKNCWAC